MTKTKFALAIPLVAAFLFGCSGSQDLFAPVEAPEIENSFNVEKVWSVNTGGVDSYYSQLSPSIDLSRIYMASRDGDVYAYDKLTGDKLWHVDLGDEEENDDKRSARLSGGLSSYAGYVAVGSENGYIYLLNAIDGTLRFKYYLGSEVLTKPAFSKSGTTLFVLDAKGSLSCFDIATGKLKYVSGENNGALRLRSQSEPVAVGDEYIIVGQSNGKINILLQENGSIANQIVVGQAYGSNALQRMADVSSTPVLNDHSLYSISYNGNFIEYDFNQHAIVNKLGYSSALDLALDDDHIIIVDDQGHIYAISRANNEQLWVNTALSYRNVTAPVIYGSYVVVGDLEGYLYFIDLNDGAIKTMIELDNSAVYTTPIVDGNLLYAVSSDGDLACYMYDPSGIALQKSMSLRVQNDYAGIGINMNAPGVGDTGIYGPQGIDYDKLMQRRQAIIRQVAQVEAKQRQAMAQQRAYERQRAEYERRVKAYEEERRRQLSGFGIAPTTDSQME